MTLSQWPFLYLCRLRETPARSASWPAMSRPVYVRFILFLFQSSAQRWSRSVWTYVVHTRAGRCPVSCPWSPAPTPPPAASNTTSPTSSRSTPGSRVCRGASGAIASSTAPQVRRPHPLSASSLSVVVTHRSGRRFESWKYRTDLIKLLTQSSFIFLTALGFGNQKLPSWHRSYHGLILKSPNIYESELGIKRGETIIINK